MCHECPLRKHIVRAATLSQVRLISHSPGPPCIFQNISRDNVYLASKTAAEWLHPLWKVQDFDVKHKPVPVTTTAAPIIKGSQGRSCGSPRPTHESYRTGAPHPFHSCDLSPTPPELHLSSRTRTRSILSLVKPYLHVKTASIVYIRVTRAHS